MNSYTNTIFKNQSKILINDYGFNIESQECRAGRKTDIIIFTRKFQVTTTYHRRESYEAFPLIRSQ